MATGCLSTANLPQIKGRESFAGASYHTGRWPHEGVDFSGKRVGIIGTGSSAVQSIPIIARQAEQLFVFQRTPTYSVPAHNAPLDREQERKIKADYRGIRARAAQTAFDIDGDFRETPALSVSEEERQRIYEKHWGVGGLTYLGAFGDLIRMRKPMRPRRILFAGRFAKSSRIRLWPKPSCLITPSAPSDCASTRLLRDFQPSERNTGQSQAHADRGNRAKWHSNQRPAL